VQTLVCQQT